MAERTVGTNTRKKLINNEPFAYAHLVKFERPSTIPANGKYTTDAKRYAYFTDAAHNLDFDDQSYNTAGGSNGSQIYIAGKLMSVGTYSETIEARASGMALEIAAESLNNAITSSAISMTSSTITVPAGIDLVAEGFREGDKIFISGGTNSGKYVNVTGIKTNNTVLVVSEILNSATTANLSTQSAGASITLSIVSDELQGPLGETNIATAKSYVNRDVWVYKAFLDTDTGAILDSNPVLIFKGIITKASIVENPGQSVRAKWTLTSHWGDFAAVRGRPTNDAVHRALDNNNRGQPEAALRPEYANDLGFLHAEETINILATYTTIETETVYRSHSSWGGFRTKMKSYTVDNEIQNDVKLDFALSSKFLPVVYGVQRIDALPVFVDTKENDPNNIFLVYALCEGEIGGIYDLYMDSNPLMCLNKEDSDIRDAGLTDNNSTVHCFGRADLGETLGGVKTSGRTVSGSTAQTAKYGRSVLGHGEPGYEAEADAIEAAMSNYYSVNDSIDTANHKTTNGIGLGHRQTRSFTAPNNMSLTFYTGTIDQKADNTLTSIAQASAGSQFKRQADYYTDDEEYWGPNHRLLDTAYVVMDVEIGEDATTVPEVEYVVRGKLCSSYNYDYSYAHSAANLSEDYNNFDVGDVVDLYRPVSGSSDVEINSNVMIIDKWYFMDPDGDQQWRFRFSTAPSLGYSDGIATHKEFYMKNSSAQTWTMATWDYTDTSHSTGTVPSENSVTATVNDNGSSAATITIANDIPWIADIVGEIDFQDVFSVKYADPNNFYGYNNFWWTWNNSTLLTHGGLGAQSTGLTAGSQTIISGNTITLASGASNTDNKYTGFIIELVKTTTAADGTSQTQSVSRTIESYDGGTKIATVNTPWPAGFEPAAGDTYNLVRKIKKSFTGNSTTDIRTDDKRVSINPAIQLLDYLTERYGKALNINTDISLADFLLAARTCDDRGTQTMQGAQAGSVGDRYVLTSDGTSSGSVVSMGLVKSLGTSNSVNFTEFEQVYGKFTKKFMKNSYAYAVGDIIYTLEGYYRVTTAGAKSTAPTGTNPTGFTGPLTSVSLFPINSTTGVITNSPVNFSIVSDSKYYNPCGIYNSTTGGYDTGYSLYDSDDIKYWRYLGWDNKHQRFATRHQCQGIVDTSTSVFENVNGFLTNFNGLLSYEGGKYALRIETASDAVTSTVITSSNTASYSGYTKGVEYNPRVITEDDIIGNITVSDEGVAKSFNTVSTQIMDPGNMFKGRSVSFYDSTYLKSDKNIVKSGNINISSVGNYYNARINVENYLRKSRFGMKISFKTGPKSLLLLAGDTIGVTNSKFGFENKLFRITNINYSKDCTAQISAEEYDDSFYTISAPSLPSVVSQDQRQGIQATPSAPSSLSASVAENVLGGINLSWTNGSGLTTANCFTEIWSHPTNDSSNRTLLTRVPFPGTTFVDQLGKKDVQRYYWIRSGKIVTLTSGGQNKTKELFSAFVGPANATTVAPISAFGVRLEGEQIFTDTSGTLSPTSIALTTTRTNSTGDVTYAAVNNSSASVTLTSASNTGVTLTSANFGSATSVVITATLTTTTDERAQGAANTYTFVHTIRKLTGGVQGNDAPKVVVSFVYHQASSSSQPSTPSATSYNVSNNTFSGLTSGWATTPPTFAAGNSNKYWYSYFRAEENTAGGQTSSGSNLVFQASQQGIGFSGLVTFTSGNTFSDGSTTVTPLQAADIGSSGSTTIDGGRITTGTVAAARISVSGKNISDLNNDSGFTTFAAANVQDAITNNVTTIDGAKITTGSIAAARLIITGKNISDLNNNSGFTNDDTANSAATAASNAQSTANTAVTNAATAQSTANSKITGAQVNGNVTSISGGVISTGVINLSTAAGMAVRAGKSSSTDTAAGFYLGNDSGSTTPKFSIGSSTRSLKWDGSNLTVTGKYGAVGISGTSQGGLFSELSDSVTGGSDPLRILCPSDDSDKDFFLLMGNDPYSMAFSSGIPTSANHGLWFTGTGSIYMGGTNNRFAPLADNSNDLGASNYRWDDVYATNGTIQTSDANDKSNIANSDLGLSFVSQLTPRKYTLTDGDSNRTHYGLIAQEVKTVLDTNSINTSDFAPYIKSEILNTKDQGTGEYKYGLRYTELISILIKSIQELEERIKILEP